MILSILIQGKNDNYGSDSEGNGGVSSRIRLGLNKLINNLEKLNDPDIEVVLCDWGSDKKIVDDLLIHKSNYLKCVYVPPTIGKKYTGQANYSISHSYNTALRHCNGQYVIFWDSDCYMRYEDIDSLVRFVKDLKQQNIFFWGSRIHIPRNAYKSETDFNQIDAYLLSSDINSFRHDKINTLNFDGRAMSLLMSRNMAYDSTGWWEDLPHWGWQDIEYHHRLKSYYKFGGDLEDYGINFFHLDHHDLHNPQFSNTPTMSSRFDANGDSWGLNQENLEII